MRAEPSGDCPAFGVDDAVGVGVDDDASGVGVDDDASGVGVDDDASGVGDEHFWERTVIGWHLVFAALLAISAGLALSDGDATATERAGAITVLAGWGLWYLYAGRRAFGDGARTWGPRYVVGAVPLCLATLALAPATSVMLFGAIPQIYALIERLRTAIVVVVALFAGFAVALWLRGAGSGVFVGLGFSALFSGVIGAWIGGIIRQSRQRAVLIAQLRRTQERLAEVSHDRGMLAERERLSRDIHDTLAQGFTSIVMLLEAAEAEIGGDDKAARRHLDLARSTARENLTEARSLVAALSPAGLADGSLVDAVGRLVHRCAQEMQVAGDLTVAGEPRRLPSVTEVVLLRAAQEGLANVRKHAAPARVEVRLEYGVDWTLLRVRDDGCGFERDLVEGFGLAGMRARAEQVGGSLRLDSAPGAGTTVELRIPA